MKNYNTNLNPKEGVLHLFLTVLNFPRTHNYKKSGVHTYSISRPGVTNVKVGETYPCLVMIVCMGTLTYPSLESVLIFYCSTWNCILSSSVESIFKISLYFIFAMSIWNYKHNFHLLPCSTASTWTWLCREIESQRASKISRRFQF